MYLKKFIVASVSTNTNSFGLYGVVIIAEDGEAWEIACNYLNKPAKDKELDCWMSDEGNGLLSCTQVSYEIPRRLPDVPKRQASRFVRNKLSIKKNQSN